MRSYWNGLDVVGDGVSVTDFVPYLGLVSKVASGLAGGGGQSAAQTAAAQKAEIEKARQEAAAQAKRDAEAAQQRTIMYIVLVVLGFSVLGLGMYVVAKK